MPRRHFNLQNPERELFLGSIDKLKSVPLRLTFPLQLAPQSFYGIIITITPFECDTDTIIILLIGFKKM